MAKAGNFNVNVDKETAEEFNIWSENTPGKKFEHTTGALKAIQAIYAVDKAIAIELMNPKLSIKDAVELLKKGFTDGFIRGWIDTLPEKKRDELLEDARRAAKKFSRK